MRRIKRIGMWVSILVFLVSACAPQAVAMTNTPTVTALPATRTSTVTTVPTVTKTPTALPTPTFTPLPPQSVYVSFIRKDGEGELAGDSQIVNAVNVAYELYSGWGCGNFPVRVYMSADEQWLRDMIRKEGHHYTGPLGEMAYADSLIINTGFGTWNNENYGGKNLGWREGLVAYELANACMMTLKGQHTAWESFESGAANALASRAIVPWLQAYDSHVYVPTVTGTAFEVYEADQYARTSAVCSDRMFKLNDQGTDAYWLNGEAAVNVLLNGYDASEIIGFYRNLGTSSKDDAFVKTFGFSPAEFENVYFTTCLAGFTD